MVEPMTDRMAAMGERELVELVARAIFDVQEPALNPDFVYDDGPQWMSAIPEAEAAIGVMRTLRAPVGVTVEMVLVPRKPNRAMIDAMIEIEASNGGFSIGEAWAHIITAALQANGVSGSPSSPIQTSELEEAGAYDDKI